MLQRLGQASLRQESQAVGISTPGAGNHTTSAHFVSRSKKEISPPRRNRLPENQTQDEHGPAPVSSPLDRRAHHRRLPTRWENHLSNFSSFTLLGYLMLTLRHLPFS